MGATPSSQTMADVVVGVMLGWISLPSVPSLVRLRGQALGLSLCPPECPIVGLISTL
jgi:hypothetical protein